MNENIIIALISAVSGGVIGQFLNYLLSSKKQHSDNYGSVLDLWKSDNERLRKIETQLRVEVDKLRDLVGDLSNKIVLLESAHLSFPFPMWLKGLDGTMLVLNSSYERTFLSPKGLSAADYVGKIDADIWDEKTAAAFKINDVSAYHSENGFVRVMEDVEGV
ncbi:MAG: hypothetical protein AAF705_08840, partial [Bacteroidota bacterium]